MQTCIVVCVVLQGPDWQEVDDPAADSQVNGAHKLSPVSATSGATACSDMQGEGVGFSSRPRTVKELLHCLSSATFWLVSVRPDVHHFQEARRPTAFELAWHWLQCCPKLTCQSLAMTETATESCTSRELCW